MKTINLFIVLLCAFSFASCKKEPLPALKYADSVYTCQAFLRNTNTPFSYGTAYLVETGPDGLVTTSHAAPIFENGFFYFGADLPGDQFYVERGDSVACAVSTHCPRPFEALVGTYNRIDVIPQSWIKIKVVDLPPLSSDTAAVSIKNSDYIGAYPQFTTIAEGDSLIRPIEGCINKALSFRYRVNGLFMDLQVGPTQWYGAFDTTTYTFSY